MSRPSDPRFAALIERARPFDVVANQLVRPFDALAESIAYQQLSGKAAATIFGRVRALYGKRKWLDPELVLKTPDEKLRACGLSRSKTAAFKDLAAKTLDGTVPTRRALVQDDRRRNHRAAHQRARDRAVDRGDVVALRAGPARCLAGRGLRRAERFRENFRAKKTADAETIREDRREMAALSLRRRLVFLAGAGCA